MRLSWQILLLGAILVVFAGGAVAQQVEPQIIYLETFSGDGLLDLQDRSPDVSLTGARWITPAISGTPNWKADGTISRPVSNQNRNAFLPFVPEQGWVYRLSLEVNPTEGNAPAEWFGLGFTQDCLETIIFSHDTVGAGPWMLQSWDRSLPGNTFSGPGVVGQQNHSTSAGWVKMEVVLDTTQEQWSAEWYCNDQLVRTYTYLRQPTINYVGFGAMRQAAGAVRNFQLMGIPAAMDAKTVETEAGPEVPVTADLPRLGGPTPQPRFVDEPIPTEPRQKEIPLIVHRMPSMPTNVISRAGRFNYADESLLAVEATIEEEFRRIAECGVTAVMVDRAYAQYAEAATKAGLKILLMINVQQIVLGNFQIPETPEGVADYLIRELESVKAVWDAMYKRDGRIVVWVYSAPRFPAEFYREVLSIVRDAGYDPFVLYHTQYQLQKTESEVAKYLEVFDGVLIWANSTEETRQTLDLVIPARDRILRETGVRKAVMLTAKPGHWRPERGLVIDPRGTAEFRQTVDFVYKYDLDGLHVESWNDFSENHHMQPTVLKSTVLADLMYYYGRLGMGELATLPEPGLYVSHRREIVLGEYFQCEVMYLPVAAQGTRTIRLVVRRQDGEVVYASEPWTVENLAAGVRTFNIPTATLGPTDVLLPVVEVNGEEIATASFCLVSSSRIQQPFTMHVALSQVLRPIEVEFTIDGYGPGETFTSTAPREAVIKVSTDQKLQRIEILKNYLPVFSADFDREMQVRSGNQDYQVVRFSWSMPVPGDEQYSNDFTNGSIRITNGRAISAFEVARAQSCLKWATYAQWLSYRAANDAVEMVFLGDERTVFTVEIPLQGFSVDVPWAEVVEKGRIEYLIHPWARLLVERIPGPTGNPWSIGVTDYTKTILLPQWDDQAWNVYYLRLITEDGAIYRSAPIQVTPYDLKETVDAYIWDVETQQRVRISAPKAQLLDVTWDLGTNTRMIPDVHGVGFDLELGGRFVREGRYSPNQVPVVTHDSVFGAVLAFDGNDVLMTNAQLTPLGCWGVDLWIKPTKVGTGSQQYIFQPNETLFLTLQPDGTIGARFGDRAGLMSLRGTTILKEHEWYRITFVYDLTKAVLMVDGRIEAVVPVHGLRERITGLTSIGAYVQDSASLQPASQGFHGLLGPIKIVTSAQEIDELLRLAD